METAAALKGSQGRNSGLTALPRQKGWPSAGRAPAKRSLHPELLRQFQPLALVIRDGARAVKEVRRLGHFLVDEAPNHLAVLQKEGNFVAADFENRAGGWVIVCPDAEARIEKARIMHPELAHRPVDRNHLGAGTGGTGLGVGNATGGIVGTTRAGTGGLQDNTAWGSSTGGINGVGRGLPVGTGGLNDQVELGLDTGGINGSGIGAGSGGIGDLNSLGAGTGGINEQNAPRFRVGQ